MDTLEQIYKRHSGGKKFNDRNSVHSYVPIYEVLFSPYRNTIGNVLEIGLFDGHGMRMWEEYFENTMVYGIDLCDQPHGGLADLRPMIAEGTHRIHLMNACDEKQVEEHFGGIMFDVVIEDASHNPMDSVKIYQNFEKHLSPGGIFVIEDLENVDRDRSIFEALGAEIIDRRHVKNRFDDVLAVIRKKQ